MEKSLKSVVIIGGGITGLVIAWRLSNFGLKTIILEKQKFIGGLATSIIQDGYKADIGPHYLSFPKNSKLHNEIIEIVGQDELVELPEDLILRFKKTCVNGRFYSGYPTLYDVMFRSGFYYFVHSVNNYLIAYLKKIITKTSPQSPKEYAISIYGKFLYEKWFKPYYDKISFREELTLEDFAQKFKPITIKKFFKFTIRNATNFTKRKKIKNNTNLIFLYFKGGMISLINGLEKRIKENGGEILVGVDIEKINHEKKIITFKKNHKSIEITPDVIIYSTSLPVALHWFENVKLDLDSTKTKEIHSILILLFVDTIQLFDSWVIIFFDISLRISRLAQQNFLSKEVVPKGKSLLSVEIKVTEDDPIWKYSDSEIFELVKKDLKKVKILKGETLDGFKVLKIRNLYTRADPKMQKQYQKSIDLINSFKNEYILFTGTDSGNLVGPNFGSNRDLEGSGGVTVALEQSQKFVQKILDDNKFLES